ncbi:thiol:disulfide interchange protein DsbG [Halomonas vilamensis]|uniref:Thiol:disulfide interchange protein n=1 Tax=Vreelandella vilamensis TaxID=531309 RepID=A0ABU1H6R3_9GAMM|nr:thiol:disulfide interchange protein DsbG [Halomonas vilamensis]MDR5899571.1 thiol:disulfide interchange protein DsbG [Halomonas vilamensis]
MPRFLTLSAALTAAFLASVSTHILAQEKLPAPVTALKNQGIDIHGQFSAPGGLRGFGASVQGREMAIYLTPDGEHAIVGTLMDSDGNDLTEPQLDEHVRAPLEAQTWALLEESHWIQDGDRDAPRVVYTFTDANCPYCQQLWEAARPWVEAGKVQMRHIMVGILAADSPGKAAAMLGADDPAAALRAHKRGDGIEASAQPRHIEEQVYANNQLFEELGLYATPTSAFQRETDNGSVRIERIEGMPNEERLIEMMGSKTPAE